MNDSIVIVAAKRTAQGKLLGALKDFTSPQLGAAAIKAALEQSTLKATHIQEVIMGCVLPAGIGQAPARQAALLAGLPVSTPCTTINKMCASGMKAVMLGHDNLLAGSADYIIAGGMESMTNAPYLVPKGRQGYRLGHGELLDHMVYDGLEDAYEKKLMGFYAEQCAQQLNFTRQQQDEYAASSLERAQKSIRENIFVNEITPITIKEKIITNDEHPLSVNIEKIPLLPPVFTKNGTVTAANSAAIADGAAALVLTRLSLAEKHGLRPLAKIIHHSVSARSPSEFPVAPIDAIQILLKKINWTIDQVDLFEINEAFAVVTLAAMKKIKYSS